MIIFQYKEEPTGKRGKTVRRPVADTFLKGKSGEWIELHPYIDSGADVTLIPLSLGKLLGFTLRGKEIEEIGGIRGSVPVIHLQNKMRIGDVELSVHLALALIEEVPPLLGRADVFDLFEVTFKQQEGIIVFKKRDRPNPTPRRC